MRKLTDQEIQKELSDIDRWPTTADFVFMKNLYDGRCGLILQKKDRGSKPIRLEPYTDQDNDGKAVTGPSLKDLIQEGWVVD